MITIIGVHVEAISDSPGFKREVLCINIFLGRKINCLYIILEQRRLPVVFPVSASVSVPLRFPWFHCRDMTYFDVLKRS